MVAKKSSTLSSLLIGDTLAKLVEELGSSSEDKLVVLLVHDNFITIGLGNVSRIEAYGALQLAVDELNEELKL